MLTTVRRQLSELGLEDRFDAVIDEVARVRAELGYPIMVTPFPQVVCSQALSNVIGAERYAIVPDQVIRYLLGAFGRPTGPVDPVVQERILSRPRARQLMAEPPPPTPAELRARFGRGVGDEELLLRAVMPAEEVDAMLAAEAASPQRAGTARRHYDPEVQPLLDLLRGLRGRPSLSRLTIEKPGLRIQLRGGQEAGDHG